MLVCPLMGSTSIFSFLIVGFLYSGGLICNAINENNKKQVQKIDSIVNDNNIVSPNRSIGDSTTEHSGLL